MEGPEHSIGMISQLQTRFLCPFFLQRQSVSQAVAALTKVTVLGRGDQPLNVWVSPRRDKRDLEAIDAPYRDSVHDLYCEEVLDHVVIYGPAVDVQGRLHDARIGTDAVIYPASW